MSDTARFQPRSVSVVVTAQFHTPSILKPDFLAEKKIVPEDWAAAETLSSEPLSIVKYGNGVSLDLDSSRLTIEEQAGPSFDNGARVREIAQSYLKKLPHVPYRSLGLNCRVFAPQSDPRGWLLERFAAPWLRNMEPLLGVQPRFALGTDAAVCYVKLFETEEEDGVIADLNVHHQGPLTGEEMNEAIRRWPERRRFIDASLEALWQVEAT